MRFQYHNIYVFWNTIKCLTEVKLSLIGKFLSERKGTVGFNLYLFPMFHKHKISVTKHLPPLSILGLN